MELLVQSINVFEGFRPDHSLKGNKCRPSFLSIRVNCIFFMDAKFFIFPPGRLHIPLHTISTRTKTRKSAQENVPERSCTHVILAK